MKMNYFIIPIVFTVSLNGALGLQCHFDCPAGDEMVCGFDPHRLNYKMFPSECAMKAYSVCVHTVQKCGSSNATPFSSEYEAVPRDYCVKSQFVATRRMYGESCPVFCPEYYRPVCGASKYRDYIYRTFINGCFLDMINCRGDDDFTGYVEVPLHYCQRHLMKNIFKERVVVSNIYDNKDYFR